MSLTTQQIEDIKKHSLAVLKSLKENILYKITSIQLEYSDGIDLVIETSKDEFTVKVYLASDNFLASVYLYYEEGGWTDEL